MHPRCAICWTIQNLEKCSKEGVPKPAVYTSQQPVSRSLPRLLGGSERIATAVAGSLEEKMKLTLNLCGLPDMRDENCSQFHHRVNADKTIDSICLRCFLTGARVENEADLHEREAAHQYSKEAFVLTETLRSVTRNAI
jgi:hypothetical protein